MNRTIIIGLIWIMFVTMFVMTNQVEAKRMGGGKSVGQQSSNVSKKQAAPPAQAATPAKPQATPATASATPAARPWGAMLGGMAAGLGLAWLASSLGMSEAFGNIMMALLIGLVILVAVGWFLKSRNKEQPQPAYEIKTVT
jgi:predicted lipid-binding transport protein (Tim44 family)